MKIQAGPIDLQPLVSIILPTKNRPQFLQEALQSISAQTYGNIEVIVVNDGGEDVEQVLSQFTDKLKIIYKKIQDRKGPSAARNVGLKEARGKYIAYLDDDDIFYPEHIETLAGFLEKTGCKVAYSDSYQAFQQMDGGTYVTADKRVAYSFDFDKKRLLVMNYIPTLNIIHDRECINEAGFFDETFETHEDWDLWIRMSHKYEFHHIKSVTAEFRTRLNSSCLSSLKRADFLRTMKIIHSRYADQVKYPDIAGQQKYVEDELEKEITHKKRLSADPENLCVVTTRKGVSSLRVKGEDGSLKTLHSMYDPEAEAKSIVDAFQFDGKGVLVVLGLGLGYHVAALAEKFPGAEIIVVEASPEIYRLAMEHGPEMEGDVKFIIGIPTKEPGNPPASPFFKGGVNSSISGGGRGLCLEKGGEGGFEKVFSQPVLKEITRHQMKGGIRPVSVFTLSPAVSAFPHYYRPVLDALKKTTAVKLWDRLRYPKFTEKSLRVVLVDSGYFLLKEAEKALASLDHKVLKVPVRNYSSASPPGKGGIKRGCESEPIVSALIEAILKFRPDFILTMNHLGFDEEGALTSFLKSIDMPVASWYVDSPNLIVKAFDKNVSPLVSLFLWDRTYIDDMKSMGFESVNYLPLGTDENVFKPIKIQGQGARGKRQGLTGLGCDAGFVGNSMVGPVNEWMSKVAGEFHPLINRLAEEIAGSDGFFNMNMFPADLDDKQKMAFEAAVLWKATMLYRLSCLKTLEGFDVRIHGDGGWKALSGNKQFRLMPPLNYYKELPRFYNACKINFNATSLQMREAVNQRVFDVPACGAFLLTDYQKGLDELFDTGRELIVYKDKDEIPGLVKYYLDNPDERAAIAGRGRERVLKDHTYRHRLKVMVEAMKERYA